MVCGIVGIFLKDKKLESEVGKLLTQMLITMSDRGPDSAGIAIYERPKNKIKKITVQSSKPQKEFHSLLEDLTGSFTKRTVVNFNHTHAVISSNENNIMEIKNWLSKFYPNLRILSVGSSLEIYKETGSASAVTDMFNIVRKSGTHAVGHTRMATESLVSTLGAHPFSTAEDQCLVHNGSLSNHNTLRRQLANHGVHCETENDSEVAAAYLSQKLKSGADLGTALEHAVLELDGFYTFLVGTNEGIGLLRDPIACKPAVVAENEHYVAIGSEYRAFVGLPNIKDATIWEPEPATVYFWEH